VTVVRGPRRTAVALAVLVSLLGLTTLATTTAGARPAAPADSTLLLQSQSGWVAPTGTFHINIRVAKPPPGAKLQARLYQKVVSPAQLERNSRGEGLGSLQQSTVTVPLDTAPYADGALDLSFPVVPSGAAPPYGFQLSREGVYPLGLTIVDDQGAPIGQLYTHLVRLPEAGSVTDRTPLTVALVVPVGAPVAHQPDGAAALPDPQAAELDRLLTTLRTYPRVPLTLEPTPETVSALSEGDLRNDTKVVAGLTAASRERQVLGGPWVTVDSGAWVGQGLTDAFGRERALGTTTLTNLLSLTPDTGTAVVDASTTPDVLSTLVAGGVHQAVVPSGRIDTTSRSNGDNPATQTFDLTSGGDDRTRSVVADDDLSARLVTGDDRVLAAHEVVASLSLLALSSNSDPCVLAPDAHQCRRGLALQLPASAADAQTPLSVLLDAFADPTGAGPAGTGDGQAIVSPMSVDNLIKVVDPASESGRTRTNAVVLQQELTSTSPASLGSYPARLRATLNRVDGFRSMVTVSDSNAPPGQGSAPDAATGGLDLVGSLDQVTMSSGSAAFDELTRQTYLDGADARIADQLGQITTEKLTVVTLTSRNGKIPLTVNNGLDYPVQVRITLKSDKLDFPDGAVMDRVTLAPRVPTRIDVPVQARASGAFKLEATITSPQNGLPITSGQFNVRSTAVSGVGLVLTIAAGLFLLLWWGRHFRRTRRAKRLIASDHPSTRAGAADPSGPADGAPPSATNGHGSGSPPGTISYAPADRD